MRKFLLLAAILLQFFPNTLFAVEPSIAAVINGKHTADKRWPWMLRLVYSGLGDISKKHHCGATLIDKRYALTAAHCVVKYGEKANVSDFDIVSKGSNFRKEIRTKITDIIIHPDYSVHSESFDHDIALLRLKDPINGTTLAVWPKSVSRGNAMLLGWGQFEHDNTEFSKDLHKANITIQNSIECEQSNPKLYNDKTMLCAGNLSKSAKSYDGVDACYGDSGGPLARNIDGKWYQLGIVSFGNGCASSKSYGFYTRLSTYFDWIYSQISAENEFALLIRDLHKKSKLYTKSLGRRKNGLTVSKTWFIKQRSELKKSTKYYNNSELLVLFENGPERQVTRLINRMFRASKVSIDLAVKLSLRVSKLSKRLKGKHAI